MKYVPYEEKIEAVFTLLTLIVTREGQVTSPVIAVLIAALMVSIVEQYHVTPKIPWIYSDT